MASVMGACDCVGHRSYNTTDRRCYRCGGYVSAGEVEIIARPDAATSPLALIEEETRRNLRQALGIDPHRFPIGESVHIADPGSGGGLSDIQGESLKAAVRRKHEEAQKWKALAEEYQRRLLALGGDERRREGAE